MMPLLDPVLLLLLRASLAVLFVSAAVHKFRDRQAFRTSLAAYQLVPRPTVPALSVLIASSEATIAVALLAAGSSPWPAFAAAGLLLVYTGAIAINLIRGRSGIDCGCAGPARRQSIGAGLVGRNLALLGAAVASALPATPRAFVWVDFFTLVSGLAASCLLYTAIEALLAGAVAPRRNPVDESLLSFEVQNG
jgi:uncharacterized membrane protein YphA (DoxX/SURF4 family)